MEVCATFFFLTEKDRLRQKECGGQGGKNSIVVSGYQATVTMVTAFRPVCSWVIEGRFTRHAVVSQSLF